MKTSHTIKLETYSCSLTLIVTDQLKIEARKVYKKHGLRGPRDAGESEGMMLTIDIDKYHLLIDLKYLSYNTIAHEVYHAVKAVTRDRSINDEEAQAWLAGHITGRIHKFLDTKKLQVKHG